jgi:methyl-accepting chemotaxis protein
LSEAADDRGVSRFSLQTDRPGYLVTSIVALANRTTTLAVDSAVAAAQAEKAGDVRGVAEHVRRLAVDAGVATGEIGFLAQELELTDALDLQIDTAGVAITGLQASLLAIAAAVQEVAEAGGPGEALASADALRNAALTLDDLLPAYQPGR